MIIKRISPITGELRELDIPITQEKYDAWLNSIHPTIAFSRLSEDERDFIVTGATGTEWKEEFNKYKKDDNNR